MSATYRRAFTHARNRRLQTRPAQRDIPNQTMSGAIDESTQMVGHDER